MKNNKKCGVIYCITSPSGKRYIGQSWNHEKRWRDYRNLHFVPPVLMKAFQKYGTGSFIFEVIKDNLYTQADMDYFEDYFILKYDSIKYGYNCKRGGLGGLHTEETKRKISESLKQSNHPIHGSNHAEETKRKISETKTGVNLPKDSPHFSDKFSLNMSKIKEKYEYTIVSPDGETFITKNLKQFCKDNNLHQSNMQRVASGKRKTCQGWVVRINTSLDTFNNSSE